MDITLYNLNHGYLDSLIRALRASFLTEDEHSLIASSCESVDDLENFLKDTYWGPIMLDSDQKPYSAPLIGLRLRERLAAEFKYLQDNAVAPLTTFLEFIARERMIDNVVNLIQGVNNKKNYAELYARCDPLGHFEGLAQLTTLTPEDLGGDFFRVILRESPIGPYFEAFIAATRPADQSQYNFTDATSYIAETNLDLMRCILKRAWLEDFNNFCQSLGGTTADVMSEILSKEADLRALSVVLNSPPDSDSRNAAHAELASIREHLFAGFGTLYPSFVRAVVSEGDEDAIRRTLAPFKGLMKIYEEGRALTDPHADRSGRLVSVEDLLFQARVAAAEEAFSQMMQFGVFYSYVVLKEQEIRNLIWIADMLVLNEKDHINEIVHIFKPRQ
eukprot:GDKJ01028842.1.p1 GENE.GDKJ01028842.1~~GDKJ01028842.1.p1  ORF type:complete len:402 (+),score=108.37 GDKJ01028842.1:40-1206(+)